MLQAQRNGDGEAVHQAPEGCAFLVHVHKDFAEGAVLIVSGAQVEFMPADDGFLRVAFAAVWQAATFGKVAVDDFFRHAHLRGLRGQ